MTFFYISQADLNSQLCDYQLRIVYVQKLFKSASHIRPIKKNIYIFKTK